MIVMCLATRIADVPPFRTAPMQSDYAAQWDGSTAPSDLNWKGRLVRYPSFRRSSAFSCAGQRQRKTGRRSGEFTDGAPVFRWRAICASSRRVILIDTSQRNIFAARTTINTTAISMRQDMPIWPPSSRPPWQRSETSVLERTCRAAKSPPCHDAPTDVERLRGDRAQTWIWSGIAIRGKAGTVMPRSTNARGNGPGVR